MNREETVTSLSSTFARLEGIISDEDQAIEGLQALLSCVEKQGQDCFDDEDLRWVQGALEQRLSRKQSLQTEMRSKQTEMHDSFKHLSKLLDRRLRILEDMDEAHGVMRKNKELRERFVRKQAELTTQLDRFKVKLERFPDDSE